MIWIWIGLEAVVVVLGGVVVLVAYTMMYAMALKLTGGKK